MGGNLGGTAEYNPSLAMRGTDFLVSGEKTKTWYTRNKIQDDKGKRRKKKDKREREKESSMTDRKVAVRIACYGDSLIQGFPFMKENSWVATAERTGAGTWENHGICGECCDDITDRVLRRRNWNDARLLLYEGGMNDIIQGVPLPFSLGQMERARRCAAEAGLPTLFVLPWYCAAAELNPFIRRLRDGMRQQFPQGKRVPGTGAAKEADGTETTGTDGPGVWFLDFEPVFPQGEGDELAAKRRPYFIWDGVHPTAETYELLGNYAAKTFMGFDAVK